MLWGNPPSHSDVESDGMTDTISQFEFWTEEENQSFIQALKAAGPDFQGIASRVGTKNVEQCGSYAQLYFQALSHGGKLEEGVGLNLSAMDVYNFHGIGPYYADFLQQRSGAASRKASVFASLGAPGCVQHKGSEEVSKSSISFLCGEETAEPAPSAIGQGRSGACGGSPAGSAGSPKNAMRQDSDGASQSEGSRWGGECKTRTSTRVQRESSTHSGEPESSKEDGGEGKGPSRTGKRLRQEMTTEDVDKLIDQLRVPHEKLWEYSAMKEATTTDTMRYKNPWEWVRKVIKKPNGYSQWWPFFTEHVNLTKREACEDLKSIRAKAPPPPPTENNPYSRKFETGAAPVKEAAPSAVPKHLKGAKGVRASPEAEAPPSKKVKTIKGVGGEGRMPIQAGDFIEVKWGTDWWHAQVVKVGRTSRTGYVWVSYVGGTEDEEEWIAIDNCRAPREDVRDVVKAPKGAESNGKGVKKKKSSYA